MIDDSMEPKPGKRTPSISSRAIDVVAGLATMSVTSFILVLPYATDRHRALLGMSLIWGGLVAKTWVTAIAHLPSVVLCWMYWRTASRRWLCAAGFWAAVVGWLMGIGVWIV